MKKPDVLTLALPDGTLTVSVQRRARKTVGIRVRDGQVELAASPAVSHARLLEVLEARKDWIVRHWRAQQARLVQRQVPEQVCVLGKMMPLLHEPASRREVRLVADALLVRGFDPQDESEAWQRLVGIWLKREASRGFSPRLLHWAAQTGLSPNSLGLSSAKRRWGSCTSRGAVRLNWRLVMAPPRVLDYVIVHELAHLEHMNHSAAFWSLVGCWMPDWREQRQWLKLNGDTLFSFG